MKVYITRKNNSINAIGEYNIKTKELTVLKGSKISSSIANSEKFKGANTIEKNRNLYATNGIVKEDTTFKSASTAANFVTGCSTNGLVAWKTEDGTSIKKYIEKK